MPSAVVGVTARSVRMRLPPDQALGWYDDPATLEPQTVAALLRAGDAVVIKGSKKMFWVNKFAQRLLTALQARA